MFTNGQHAPISGTRMFLKMNGPVAEYSTDATLLVAQASGACLLMIPTKSELRKCMERCALFICFPLLWWNEVRIRADEAEFWSPALVTVPKWSWTPLVFLVNDPLD